MPVSVSGSVARLLCESAAAIAAEVGRAGRAVDHRQPVEQRGGADRADDQVLQARTRASARGASPSRTARTAGARGARGRRTARRCSAPPRAATCPATEVSSSAWNSPCAASLAAQRAPGEQDRAGAAGDQDDVQRRARGRRPAARRRRSIFRVPLPDRQPERGRQGDEAERRHELAADPARPEQADEQDDDRAAQQGDQRREAGEVDVRALQVAVRGGGDVQQLGVHGVTLAVAGWEREGWLDAAWAEATAALDRVFAAVQRELRVQGEEQDHQHDRHEHDAVA